MLHKQFLIHTPCGWRVFTHIKNWNETTILTDLFCGLWMNGAHSMYRRRVRVDSK